MKNHSERKPSERRNTVTMQQLLDAGLNAFGAELLAESINGHRQKEAMKRPITFVLRDVVFTLSLCPDRNWTHEELLEILKPIAAIDTIDSYLVRFARAFVAADEEERPFLAHVALMLIDKYSLWTPDQPK